jgi:hypothetical protein
LHDDADLLPSSLHHSVATSNLQQQLTGCTTSNN